MTRLIVARRELARYFGLPSGAAPAASSRWGPERRPAAPGRNLPYLALLITVVVPLLWIAAALAVRSGVASFTGPPPSSEQLTALMTFIGGGFATSAALVATLFTRDRSNREQKRLKLETHIRSLEVLPSDSTLRVSGYMTTMMLLGEPEIAMRVLDSAWKDRRVDASTATWLIDKVLFSDHMQVAAVKECTAILMKHAGELTDPATKHLLYFPGHYLRRWKFDQEPPPAARESVLQSMAKVLLSQDPDWWLVGGELPSWPTEIFADCVLSETDERIRVCAAVLLDALFQTFPKGLDERLGAAMRPRVADIAEHAHATVPPSFSALAGQIKKDWATRETHIAAPLPTHEAHRAVWPLHRGPS